jgi:hypothetical protein
LPFARRQLARDDLFPDAIDQFPRTDRGDRRFCFGCRRVRPQIGDVVPE